MIDGNSPYEYLKSHKNLKLKLKQNTLTIMKTNK